MWQDGGVLIHFPTQGQWVAVFLKFQSQGWHTDDKTEHRIGAPEPSSPPDVPIPTQPPLPTSDDPQGLVEGVEVFLENGNAEIKKHGHPFPKEGSSWEDDLTPDPHQFLSQGILETKENGKCVISRLGWKEFALYLAHRKGLFWERMYRGDLMHEFERIKNRPRQSFDEMYSSQSR